ncbi:MAG TPA: pantetheine-phosphate adenylyltransferase [Terriglobales bacterium]|nr:pantetheine-phosphate adenylyltransferase [Terriglobales bacterium]
MRKIVAIYPGSFDPPTNGHLDLIERGSQIFDELVVAILRNPEKEALFTLGERRRMLEALTRPWPNVRVDTFTGLLVDYAVGQKAQVVLRGIRAISDYEYELQMALMNRKLQPQLETVFMMPAEAYSYLSSRLVKEVAHLGGDVRELVPPLVAGQLKQRMRRVQAASFRPSAPGSGEAMNSARRGRADGRGRPGQRGWRADRRAEARQALGTKKK